MRNVFLSFVAAGALTAQSVGGPVLGYVIDGEARMRPLFGMAASAHVGASVREGVSDSWGPLALLANGTALRDGVALEGRWASVQPGAFLDASEREVLVAAGGAPWQLALPERALAVRVSASGALVATLLADESVAVWARGGKAEFRLPASRWWSLAFAGERLIAYDPAANELLWLDGVTGATVARKLDGAGSRLALAVDGAGRNAILLGERLLVAPLDGGDVRVLTPPNGADRLESLQGGRSFLLTRNPAQPMWIFDPGREDGFLVVPAVSIEKGGQQ